MIPEEEEVVVYNSKQQGVEDVGTPDRAPIPTLTIMARRTKRQCMITPLHYD